MRSGVAPSTSRPSFLDRLRITQPILQAPMAGVAPPALAAAVSEAGGLGALGLGPISADAARPLLVELRSRTDRAFGVNLFCAPAPMRDADKEAAWIERLRPAFEALGAPAPAQLTPLFQPSLADEAMLALLLETRPALVSFHLGLPKAEVIAALRQAGVALVATATNLDEAQRVQAMGFDAVVAQGIEAGGHRGVFDPDADDRRQGTLDLVRSLAPRLSIPVIAAGGLMDGGDIAAALRAGAVGAQLGTAFLCCPETVGHEAYRAMALRQNNGTVLTRAISGHPARAVKNMLTALVDGVAAGDVPPFPLPFAASRALAAAAPGQDHAILWAGAELHRARALPAAALMQALVAELRGQ